MPDRNSGRTENQKENGTLSDKNSGNTENQKENEKSGEASDLLLDAATDPMLPTEVIFELPLLFSMLFAAIQLS